MVRIGVITFHNNENRGAILQAHSLCDILDRVFDADVEVVEYRTASKELRRKKELILSKKPLKIFSRYNDRRIVEDFFDRSLPTSSNSLITDNHSTAVEWLKEQGYDMLITGSDEIWKVRSQIQNNLLQKLSSRRPFPNLYFLDPELSATKVAYAASGNQTNLNQLSDEQIETFKRHLQAYDAISVRDRHTETLVQNLGINEVSRVPDPTLMTEIPERNAASILEEQGVNLEQPILGFHAPDTNIFQEICEMYHGRGYQIVTPRSSELADIEFEGIVDPFEYYAMYEHFDMMVTNSLHSSIFSIKHGTPFVTIDINERYRSLNSKTHSLLDDFSLLERHIDAVDGDVSKFYENQTRLEEEPDKDHIENRIGQLQGQGYEFLNEVKNIHEENN